LAVLFWRMLRFLKRKVILFFFLNEKIIRLLEKIQKLQINKKKIKATDNFTTQS